MYTLIATDMTAAGGPMHYMSHPSSFQPLLIKQFKTVKEAKACAQKHYSKKDTIKWYKEGDRYETGDLRWVSYTITRGTKS